MKRATLLLLLAGCTHDRPHANDKSALVATSSSDVVATVDDRPIYAVDVEAEMKASGKDRGSAVEVLVDAEVLAGRAAERGLSDDFEVVHARRAAEGRRLLATDFEPRTTLDKIPDADLRRAYDLNRFYYDHDEMIEVQHIIASVPEGAPPATFEQAHAEIAALEPKAKLVRSNEDFAALADAQAPVPTHVEQLPFPRHGSGVVAPFVNASLALDEPGDVSPPVRTSFGWHLIRLVRRDPPRHVSIGEAEAELRAGSFGPWRAHMLETYIQDLVEKMGVVVHKDRVPGPNE